MRFDVDIRGGENPFFVLIIVQCSSIPSLALFVQNDNISKHQRKLVQSFSLIIVYSYIIESQVN